MLQVEVKNISGKVMKKVSLPEAIYGVEMNEPVLHAVVKAYRANRRQGTHATKTRSYVSGGGKKPFKQKGTGNARQGSSRSPLHPGGAVCHGPQPRDYSEKVNQQMKQLALRVALSDKVRSGKLVVVDNFSLSKYSTKHVVGALKALGVTSATLSDERKDDVLFKSARNIHRAHVVSPTELNAEHVLRYETVVLSENALTAIQQRFEEKKNAAV